CDYTQYYVIILFFFFQAEDGIRDLIVTGVQTCALPILARWAGVQNVSRPMVRCHEISQITPTTALVDASTRALTCHGTVGARGGTPLATVTETPFQLDGSVRAVYGFVKPWCFKQKPRSWRRRTLPSQSTSLPTLRWPSSTVCIASRSGSTPTSE